jgi:hypothetical protein
MTPRFLLDEHLRGLLHRALIRHARKQNVSLDVIAVGDVPGLPLGSKDPEILSYVEKEERILITSDVSTMFTHLDAHLAAGGKSPGIFFMLPSADLDRVLDFVVIVAEASESYEWYDRIEYLS